MDKIIFDFEKETVRVESDCQSSTMTVYGLQDKKNAIIEAAGLESFKSDDFQRELFEFLRKQMQDDDKVSKKHKIALKKVDEPLSYITTTAKYRCELKDYVVAKATDCDILQNVYLNEDATLVMIVDEDGHAKGDDLNMLIETDDLNYPMEEIRGNVVFARIKKLDIFKDNYDYELDTLTEDDIDIIERLVKRSDYLRTVLRGL